jgi:hypothetical protein
MNHQPLLKEHIEVFLSLLSLMAYTEELDGGYSKVN